MSAPVVRCAIYTRKSSDEGLEQSFNSLDAQREACAAYILSQASEGWTALPDRYDDGGLSGGTLERPALQRLLEDVKARRIDVIVVYKVDRLSRSLFDFAKLVEAFEKADTSFVSITQAFNTTSSMGRLTLNMLLSFAQFEREVTAERIRDKIAASKARGMWMGGVPPLGYRPDGRSLAVVDEHAAIVRDIFARYLELPHTRALEDELAANGIHAPLCTTASGRAIGGRPFSRGQLHTMLKCRTYLGQTVHGDQVYPGLHPAILDVALWEAVQTKLADATQGNRDRTRATAPSLLAGRIVDGDGEPLIATHANTNKGGVLKRHRYYVSRALHRGDSSKGLRVPAREIERVVVQRLAAALDDPLTLVADARITLPTEGWASLEGKAQALAAEVRATQRPLVTALVERVRVGTDEIGVTLTTAALAERLGGAAPSDHPLFELVIQARIQRSGMAVRLIHSGQALTGAHDHGALPRLLAQARGWWAELRKGELDVGGLAAREGKSPSYVTRVVRLAFLSPKVTDAILDGRQRAGIDGGALTLRIELPSEWSAQARLMLPA